MLYHAHIDQTLQVEFTLMKVAWLIAMGNYMRPIINLNGLSTALPVLMLKEHQIETIPGNVGEQHIANGQTVMKKQKNNLTRVVSHIQLLKN